MNRARLPILRPLVLIAALPLAAMSCLSALEKERARASAPAAPGPYAYVSNEGSGDLTVIDTATDTVVATIPLGKRPRGVRVDASGKRVYAALSGTPRQPPGVEPASSPAPDRAADGIAVVDATTHRLAAILPSGQDPESFDLLADGKTLVVSNEETASASIVDVSSARIVGNVPVGREPEGVTAVPGGTLVAVTSERESRVTFVDAAAQAAVGFVPTCLRPRSVTFTRDGALGFAPCEEGEAVQVIDARARRPLGTVALPPGSRPMGAVLSPDGARLYVTNGRAGTVSAIDVASRKVIATVADVGPRCWGVALTPDGKKLYVAAGSSDDVAVLDAASLAVLKRIPAGTLPWGVAIAR